MALVSLARYRVVTLDTTSDDAAVTAAIETAQELVEEYLRRELEEDERTETLLIAPNGRVYPSVTPIASLGGDDADLTVLSEAIVIGPAADSSPTWLRGESDPVATITYTGGYTDETVPASIERAIAFVAKDLLVAPASDAPAGAVAVRVGDVSIDYGDGGSAPGPVAPYLGLVRRYRRRFV